MSGPILFPSLRGYERRWIRNDLIAALTVWAVLVPESLAYATIAGVSPVVGLYAAPGALILYAAFGSSRHLITGPMSATAALSAAIVADAVVDSSSYAGFTAALAICTGIIALVAGLLRLGFLASFISEPVLKGFIIGLALTIMIGQVPKLFGIEGSDGDFFEKLWHIITNLGETQADTLAVGASSLAVVLILKRFAPAVPASLVAVVLGVALVKIFDLADHGVEIVGDIQSGLPTVQWPDVPAKSFLTLAGSSVGVALIGFAEGLGAAKTYAAKEGYEIDPNRELIGLGAANFGAGMSSGMVVNGSLSKTAVNGGAGATSQVSGIATAVLTIITLLFFTGLFEELPEATLAAVVIAAVIELIDFPALARLYRAVTGPLSAIYGHAARADFIAATAAMLGVLIFDTLPGLVIGIATSMGLLLYRASRPNIAVLGRLGPDRWVDIKRAPNAVPADGIVVLRPEGGLFFANADAIREAVLRQARPPTTGIVLDGETMPFIDITGAEVLKRISSDLARRGVRFALARDIGQVRDLLRSAGEGPDSITVHATVEDAVQALSVPPAESS